ncbi:Outer membrane protein assembly factor BamB precursor [compost metagenome]
MKQRSVACNSSSTTWPKGMRDVIRWKHAALLALALLAAGCSSNSKKELPPAELTDFKEEVVLKKQWSRSIGDGQGETYNMLVPAIENERIFAADVSGVVMAMDRYNGDVLWKKDLELPVSGAVGVGYGLVMIGTLKGEVVALDAISGEEKWRSRVTSEVLAPPATNGDVVVVQTQDDRIIGLDASTGNQRWIYESTPAVLTLRGTGAPIVTNRLAVAGLSTGKVIALDTQNGVPVWEQRVAIPQGRSELDRVVDIDGGLLLSGGILYVASYQGRVAGLDLESGRVLWQRDASSYAGVSQGFGSVYVSLASGTVEGIDERSSSALWSNDALARRQLSAPEVFSSYVAVGDLEGYLHLLSQVDGRFVGRERIDSDGLRARPLVVGDTIYVYGNSGKLEALTIK